MSSKPIKVQRSWVREYKPFEREKQNDKFYNSYPWRKLRKNFINANPLCVRCESVGLVVAGKVVDHILPITKGGEALNKNNLQSLCVSCHNSKSSYESRGMG